MCGLPKIESHVVSNAVMVNKKTRNCLILSAGKLFSLKGYHGASIQELSEECNIKKGSFFHHFPTKQAIALELIEELKAHCESHIFNYSYDKKLPPIMRVEKFIDAIYIYFNSNKNASAPFAMGMELVGVNHIFDKPISTYLSAWENAIETLLGSFYNKTNAQLIARDSMVFIHGSLAMQRIYREPEYIKWMCERLKMMWRPDLK